MPINHHRAGRQPVQHAHGIGQPLRIGKQPQPRSAQRPLPPAGFHERCIVSVGLLRYRGSMSEIDGSAHAAILARIAAAAKQAGRDPAAVRLVAVSKQQLPERVAAVLAAGQRLFGENRVQEAIQRWTPLKDQHADLQLRLIGPLQSNKAKDAVAFFDAIDSVDRDKLARALADEIQRQAKTPALLIQINTGEEPQKAGVLPAEADAFIKACRTDYGLDIKGLMAIPPQDEEPAMHFALLAKIAARNGLSELSMGMSGDFETAIRFGATMVRVGSAVFGDRAPPPNL